MGYELVLAPAMRSRRWPKHTVQPASRRSMRVTNVIQKPKRSREKSQVTAGRSVKFGQNLFFKRGGQKGGKFGVNDEPGAVFVLAPIPRPFIECRTRTKSAISMAKAISVRSAARKDISDAKRVTVTWVENERSNAMKIAAVAANNNNFMVNQDSKQVRIVRCSIPTGCTANPRVHEALTTAVLD